jgi:hypothetical protein
MDAIDGGDNAGDGGDRKIPDSELAPRALLAKDGRQGLASRDLACTVPYRFTRPTVDFASERSRKIP